MNLSKTVYICATAMLFIALSGCTVILPKSQNIPHNVTSQVGSSGNVTISIQALGEHQRFNVSQLVSYSAKQGHKLVVYEANITNLGGARQVGNTTFFTLVDINGTVYQAVLNTLSPHVTSQRETVSWTVIFEIPQLAVPYELRYDDRNSNVTVGVKSYPT